MSDAVLIAAQNRNEWGMRPHFSTTNGQMKRQEYLEMKEHIKLVYKLAMSRQLPAAFEESWQKRTGVNPVRLLVEEMGKRRWRSDYATICFVVGLVFSLLLIIFGQAISWDARSESNVMGAFVISLSASPVFLLVSGILFVSRHPLDERQCGQFCELVHFFHSEVQGVHLWENDKHYLMDDLRFRASEKLVRLAIDVQDAEKEQMSTADPTKSLYAQAKKAELWSKFVSTHSKFHLLGVAPSEWQLFVTKAKRLAEQPPASAA